MLEVTATAPVRIADAGGWTDTWFAGHGAVCSLAVRPGAVARVIVGATVPTPVVRLEATNTGDREDWVVGGPLPGRHPLLEAAIARWAPRHADLRIEVGSAVPPGSGVGTSAAVTVALVAALRALRAGTLEVGDRIVLALAAHEVETVDLGQQSGVQDQLAATHGGALLIDVDPYPVATVRRLTLSPVTWSELRRRLVTVYLGRPHRSSAVHRQVIDRLQGDERLAHRLLEPLRRAARDAAAALEAGDVPAWAEALSRNTEAQAALHPALVGEDARELIDLARANGAIGWKVNGAGGDGGSVTLVAGGDAAPLRQAVEAAGHQVLGLHLSSEGLVLKGS